MTKQLAETFGLPDYQQPTQEDIEGALEKAQDLEKTFSKINGFDEHDQEMDTLGDMAVSAHQQLMELGMNVETRLAGEIFSSSAAMLKIAVDAKNSKVEKKLKLIKLQLDKMRLDANRKDPAQDPIKGGDLVMDRNEIIASIKKAQDKP